MLTSSVFSIKWPVKVHAEIMRPHGNHRSVMVVTHKNHDPVHKPPPLFCLMLACRKGGRICGVLQYSILCIYTRVSFRIKGSEDCSSTLVLL